MRRIGRIAGRTILAIDVVLGGFMTLDVNSAEQKWPDNETTITIVGGSENQPVGPEVPGADQEFWIVFPGLGQVNADNGGRQLHDAQEAAGVHDVVASVKEKNQGISKEDVQVLEQFLDLHHVKRVGIVGISMGLPTGLDWFSEIVRQADAAGKPIAWEIQDIVGYSSPYDSQDPWKSDLLRKAAETKYPGGLLTKFLYNADLHAIFGTNSTDEERRAAAEKAIQKTLNECSPKLFTSQAQLLANVDPSKWQALQTHTAPGVALVYMIGELPDDTVNAQQAANKYFEGLGVIIDATLYLIKVIGAGHANTVNSALALEHFFQQQTRGAV